MTSEHEIVPLRRDIAQAAFEKLVIDELTEQFKWHEQAVKERFLAAAGDMDGAKVESDLFEGLASLSKVSGKKGKEGIACYVGDADKFARWCRANVEAMVEYCTRNADDFATFILKETGEEPDGAKAEYFKTPNKPSYARWNIKRDEMKELLSREYGFELDAAMPRLLESGKI